MCEDEWLESHYEDVNGGSYEEDYSDDLGWNGDIPETDDELYEMLESDEFDFSF